MKILRPCEGTCETRGWMSTIYTLLHGIDEWTRKPVSSRLRAHNYVYIRLNSDDQNKHSIHLNFEHGGEFWKSQ